MLLRGAEPGEVKPGLAARPASGFLPVRLERDVQKGIMVFFSGPDAGMGVV